MIVLPQWYGRLGNNLLSVLNAIHLAVMQGHTIVRFPPHELFTQTEIRLSDGDDNPTIIPMANMDPGEADPKLDLHTLRQYFQAHVKDVCTVTSDLSVPDDTLYIHLRSGDIFVHPHPKYVQPPMSYYNRIIQNYDNIVLISENRLNPCVQALLDKYTSKIVWRPQSMMADLRALASATHLVGSFSTFTLAAFILNTRIRNFYLPQSIDGSWCHVATQPIPGVSVHVMDVPHYIPVGQWKNTAAQRQRMLTE